MTFNSQLVHSPFARAALCAYDNLRFTHDLLDYLTRSLVVFAMARAASKKETSPELLIQEAMVRGRTILSFGFDIGYRVEPWDIDLLDWEFYYKPVPAATPAIEVDADKLKEECLKSIADNPKAVEQYRKGKEAAINSLKGPVIKAVGKNNIDLIDKMLKQLLT